MLAAGIALCYGVGTHGRYSTGNAAKSVNRPILKRSRHIGFSVFIVHSSMGEGLTAGIALCYGRGNHGRHSILLQSGSHGRYSTLLQGRGSRQVQLSASGEGLTAGTALWFRGGAHGRYSSLLQGRGSRQVQLSASGEGVV